MKYKLYCYGESFETTCHTFDNSKLERLLDLMKLEGIDDLQEVRLNSNIFKKLSIDIFEPDLFHKVAPVDDSSLKFVLKNEKNMAILKFNIDDMKDFFDLDSNFISENDFALLESKYCKGLEIFDEGIIQETDNQVLFTYDQHNGGIFCFDFESDDIPKLEDFAVIKDDFSDQEKSYPYISCILFKGKKLNVSDMLDSDCYHNDISLLTRYSTKNNCYFKFSISDGDFS